MDRTMANLAVHMRISSSPRSIGRMSRTIQRQTPSYNHDHWSRFLMLRRTGMVDVIRTTTTTTTTASPRSVLDHSTTTAAATAPPATAVNTFPIKKESQASQQPQQQQLSSSSLLSSQRGKFSSLNQDTSFQLVFLRHGQSTWNRDNRFIGWTDTPLTNDGVLEARVAGQMLYQSGLQFDEVHTSLLRRSIRTTNLVLMELGQEYIPVYKHWRLNERNYGSLTGQHKKQVVQQFGKDQVKRWRRSYDEPPPEMTDDHPYHPARDPRYRLMLDDIPKSESLKDTLGRSSVYWDEVLVPALRQDKALLVIGHENNLRSLIMHLEGISPQDIIHLNLPRAVPLAYRLDMQTLQPLDRPDGQLDEATGFLRGEWVGGDSAVSEILKRDYQQVYDTSIQVNLETTSCPDRQKWTTWMSSMVGQPSPEAKAKATETTTPTTTTTMGGDIDDDQQQQLQQQQQRGFFRSTATAPPVPGVQHDHLLGELSSPTMNQSSQTATTTATVSPLTSPPPRMDPTPSVTEGAATRRVAA